MKDSIVKILYKYKETKKKFLKPGAFSKIKRFLESKVKYTSL